MFSLIAAESAIFTIFVVAYIFYIGEEPQRTDPSGSASSPNLQYDLPALKQLDYSFGN